LQFLVTISTVTSYEVLAFVVSKDPKMTVLPHFFSEAECDHLINLVEGSWMPSLVGQSTKEALKEQELASVSQKSEQPENTVSHSRTSWSCLLRPAQTSIVERLEHRLAHIAGLPGGVGQMESMNMVRYAPGELFNEHHDGKFRPVTVFVYLNDLPEDDDRGDTFFPVLGLSFKPRKGTAVMWKNATEDGSKADSRMMHAGRAPTKGIKYGVNCFTNETVMRKLVPHIQEVSVENATIQRVSELADGSPTVGEDGSPILCLYKVICDPKIIAIPGFLSQSEVDELLREVKDLSMEPSGPFALGTQVIHRFPFESSPVIEAIEHRCSTVVGQSVDQLSKLQVVRPGMVDGLCNRGCGKYSIYVCLSQADEAFFPRLGVRFLLGPGDALSIPNANFDTGEKREEMRSVRYHRQVDGSAPALGLDCFFHDNPVRAQQKIRKFVLDSEVNAC
jgi:hypothetical protein